MQNISVDLNKQFNYKDNNLNKQSTFTLVFNKFIDSEYFFIATILIMGVLWYFQMNVVSILFSILFIVLILWLKNDFKPVLMVLSSLCFITRITYGVACLLLLFFSFFYVCKNKIKINYDKRMLNSLFLLSLATLFAGFLFKNKVTSYIDIVAFPAYILVCVLFVCLYSLFDKTYLDYVLKILYYIGMFVALQLFVYYLRFFDHKELIYTSKLIFMGDDYLDTTTGWGISNHVGCLFLYTIPATLYMATKDKMGGRYYIPAIIMFVALVLTGSRGSLLFMSLAIMPMLAFSCLYSKSKRNNFIWLFALFLLGIYIVYRYKTYIYDVLEVMLAKGTSSSGRDILYSECIDAFRQNILFGVGNTYKAFGYAHSTVFQFLANAGLLGLYAILYHFVVKYVPFVIRTSRSNIFAFCALFIPECYGLIDCNFFIANFMFLSAMLIIGVYYNEEKKITEIDYTDSKFGLISLKD